MSQRVGIVMSVIRNILQIVVIVDGVVILLINSLQEIPHFMETYF